MSQHATVASPGDRTLSRSVTLINDRLIRHDISLSPSDECHRNSLTVKLCTRPSSKALWNMRSEFVKCVSTPMWWWTSTSFCAWGSWKWILSDDLRQSIDYLFFASPRWISQYHMNQAAESLKLNIPVTATKLWFRWGKQWNQQLIQEAENLFSITILPFIKSSIPTVIRLIRLTVWIVSTQPAKWARRGRPTVEVG